MTPEDFRDELGAVDGNALALEPTLHHSAWFRPHNRSPDAAARVGAVEAWCDTGKVDSMETEVLARLAERHEQPRAALRDFCRGMRDDLEELPICSEAGLDRYCYRVAGTVGIVMAAVLG